MFDWMTQSGPIAVGPLLAKGLGNQTVRVQPKPCSEQLAFFSERSDLALMHVRQRTMLDGAIGRLRSPSPVRNMMGRIEAATEM